MSTGRISNHHAQAVIPAWLQRENALADHDLEYDNTVIPLQVSAEHSLVGNERSWIADVIPATLNYAGALLSNTLAWVGSILPQLKDLSTAQVDHQVDEIDAATGADMTYAADAGAANGC